MTLFPGVYRRYAHLTLGHGPYLATGKVQENYGAFSLTARDLQVIQRDPLQSSG
ncbi:hypothetical protein KAX22_07710 [bacterium]|nr:hypothetical protein [bacterium]